MFKSAPPISEHNNLDCCMTVCHLSEVLTITLEQLTDFREGDPLVENIFDGIPLALDYFTGV